LYGANFLLDRVQVRPAAVRFVFNYLTITFLKNFHKHIYLEAFAQFTDHSPHVWNQYKDSKRPETPQQHQELSRWIWFNLFWHPTNPD